MSLIPGTFSEGCNYIQHFGGYCLHPLGGRADSPPGTQVILHPGCREERLYFCATPQHEIKHKGSGLCIVPQSTNVGNNVKLVLNHCGSSASRFRVTAGKFPFLKPFNFLKYFELFKLKKLFQIFLTF